ncbi:unnamed protein product [Durusdinium trenchii]|uniref:Ion transport domain-containing protein n=1 Tax=Durusdinium trenchii TaxID=1381693 RepID=A0ABP0SCW2_9DINO
MVWFPPKGLHSIKISASVLRCVFDLDLPSFHWAGTILDDTGPSRAPVPLQAVSSWQFEAFFAVVIATNSLFIGLSIEWEAQERTFTLPTELFVIQITYTLLFLAEVCLKLLAFGARDFFCSSGWAWNCFDLAIVMSAVFECTVEFVAHDPHLSAGSSSNLRILRILRMTRLTRIFRVIRVVRFFRSLRTLVFSIVNTLKSLFWAMLLLAMIMYVFGILFTDISNNHIIESGTPEAGAGNQTTSLETCQKMPMCMLGPHLSLHK